MGLGKIIVGTCGFSASRKKIYADLDAVEVQQTFYDPRPPESFRKYREEAPEDFRFTVKAWMLVTHGYNKRLWRRLKSPPPGDPSAYKSFADTREVWEAWKTTLDAADALRADAIVLQTPASFTPSRENVERLENFFSKAERRGFTIVWEPRGEWWKPENRGLLDRISRDYDISIAGDFLRGRLPTEHSMVAYARLHGLGGGEVNYKYRYTDDDLERLKSIVLGLRQRQIYVMFNNVYSYTDAVRFKRLLEA